MSTEKKIFGVCVCVCAASLHLKFLAIHRKIDMLDLRHVEPVLPSIARRWRHFSAPPSAHQLSAGLLAQMDLQKNNWGHNGP